MAQSFPIGKPRLPGWLLTPFCLVVAVGGHVLWLGMEVEMRPPPPGRDAPALTTVTSTQWKDWTPVLFSLPTSKGFSSVLGRVEADVLPPVTSPLKLTERFDFDAREWFDNGVDRSVSLPQPDDRPITTEPLPLRTPSPDGVVGWRMSAPGRPEVQLRFYRDPRLRNPERALRIEGEMRFDSFGQLSSLILEPGSGHHGWVDQLLPDLRQVRVDAGTGDLSTRFRLEYFPEGRSQ